MSADIKYGVLPFGLSITNQIAVTNSLGTNYVRDGQIVSNWSGRNVHYEDYINAGFHVLLNLNFLPQTTPQPFASDLTAYAAVIDNILTTYSGSRKPELIVIENEETNEGYHSGTMAEYLAELAAAIPVVHSHGLEITNGGIHPRGVCYWVWRDFVDRGMTTEASDWMDATFNTPMRNAALTPGLNPTLDAYWTKIDDLLTGYTSLDIDYVNLHIYEPINDVGDGIVTIPGCIQTMADYIRTRTGKPVMSNEWGVRTLNASLVTSMMQAFYDADFAYAIEFSGDSSDVYALENTSAPYALRDNGIAFRDFIAGESVPCDFFFSTSVQDAINGTNSGRITVNVTSGGAYEYSLDGMTFQASNEFNNLLPGHYTVYVQETSTHCLKFQAVILANDITAQTPIPGIIPYQDSKNICFFFRLIIADTSTYISEPIKWDSVQVIGERDKDYHGYQFKYTDGDVSLGFDCAAGRDLIEGNYNEFGEDGDVKFQFGYHYQNAEYILFPGKLMLNTYKWYADRVECSVAVDDFDETFLSRLETKVSMAQSTTFDNTAITPPAPYSLLFHAKEILSQIQCNSTNIDYEDASEVTGKFFSLLPDNTNPSVADIEDNFQYPLSMSTVNPYDGEIYLLKFSKGGGTDLSLSWNFTGNMRVHNGGIGGEDYTIDVFYAYNKKNTDNSYTLTQESLITQITGSVGTGTTDVALSIIASKSLTDFAFNIGDEIFFFAYVAFTGTVDCLFTLHQNSFIETISHRELTTATNANTWFIDDVIRQTLKVIADNRYVFKSSFFERKNVTQIFDGCAALNVLTNGFQIRAFDPAEKPLYIDFKTIIESLRAQYCIGINYATISGVPVVRMERVDYFYQDRQIMAISPDFGLEGIADYYEEVAKEIIYNEIEIGYDKFLDSGFNTLDEFNTKHEYLTPIQKNKAKLSQVSKFITSGYSIEDQRRIQFAESPTDSATNDDDPFFVCVKRSGVSDYVTEKDESFDSVTNLISPETSYNLRISPARMLYNWFIWLKGIFNYKQPTDLIKSTYVAQNGALTTEFSSEETCPVGDLNREAITENADIPISQLQYTRDIYSPEWVNVKCRLSPADVQIINLALSGKYGSDKDYGYVLIKKPDNTWQAVWVYNLSYNYSSEECTIKGLKKYPNQEVPIENCCPWVTVTSESDGGTCYLLINNQKLIA
jgi:hypothetical protein